MNTQKQLEQKVGEHEDGDHAQPINLAAARAPVPITTYSGTGPTVPTQPLTMRAHVEPPPKPGLMTLYFRTPSTRPQSMVSSPQHFSAKHAPDFKNSGLSGWTEEKVKMQPKQRAAVDTTKGRLQPAGHMLCSPDLLKVIRMPHSDIAQGGAAGQGGNSQGTTLTQGILPSALRGGSRHMIPAAVHPVITAGSAAGSGPMASIIRGSHQGSQAGHVIHQPFSSHVPRGPAAVASISAAPKSAVATPILRTPHSSATMALASASSMMALHNPVRAKSPTMLAGRTGTPPVSATTLPQVIDLQKSSVSVGHPLTSTHHIGLASRPLDGSRAGGSHSSAITIAKSISISQPIVQHLQQKHGDASEIYGQKHPVCGVMAPKIMVYDKNALKPVPTLTTTTNSTPAHQTLIPGAFTPGSEAVTVGVVPTIARSNISTSGGYSTGVVQLSTAGQHVPVASLRASQLPQAIHALNSVTSGSASSHSTFTVISAKSLPQAANHSLSSRTATANTSTGSIITCASMLPGVTSRPLNTAVSASIPVAKVYPQQMSGTTHSNIELSTQDNVRSGSFVTQSATSAVTRVNTPTTAASGLQTGHQTVMLSEKHSESGASVRFASLSKSQVGSATSYAPASSTYLYDQYQGNLTMHPYSGNSTTQGFSNPQLRPLSFSQHSSNSSSHPAISVSSSSTPVQQLNSVMVAVDSRHHVALHSTYNSSGAKSDPVTQSSSLPNTHGSSSVNTAASASVTSVVTTTTYNTLQSQGNVSNHTSPRPSILRKRASDGLCSIAKKNLLSNFCGNEPVSPHGDFSSSIIFSSVQSPKPNSDLKENGSATVTISEGHLLAPATLVIKKEPSEAEDLNSIHNKDTIPSEASPRKKPRKQLLAANELIETHSSDAEENNFDRDVKPKVIKEEFGIKDEDKSKCLTFYKRPSMSLLHSYRHTWKSRHNHFARYSDVKPKEEKKPTVNELVNQKGILQQANGWKVYHLTAQMDEVFGLEESVYSRLSTLLDFMEKDPPTVLKSKNVLNSEEDKILTKLTDLIKGNLQRSKIVQEQVTECKQQVMKVLDHKSNIHEIVNKYVSKRTLKKKDKT